MRRILFPLAALPLLALLAADAPPPHVVAMRRMSAGASFRGLLAAEPLQEAAFSPEAYVGDEPLHVAEAAPPGTRIRKGEAILRFATVRIDDLIRDAEAAVRAAEESRRISGEEMRSQEIADRTALAAAETDLGLAEARRKAFLEAQRPQRLRDVELGVKGIAQSVEDQEDELAQLESMYKASELAHDTKEIVLKRARRNLARTRERLQLSRDQRDTLKLCDLSWEEAQLVSAEAQKRAALESSRIARQAQADRRRLEAEKAGQDLGRARERLARLARDRERMTVLADDDGIVVHASAAAIRAGSAELGAHRLEAGTSVSKRAAFLSLLPLRAGVVFARVGEDKALRLAGGMEAEVSCAGRPFPWKATIARVAWMPAARLDGKLAYEVQVSFAIEADGKGEATPLPRHGQEAEVKVALEVLAVPEAAVLREGAKTSCRVQGADGAYERREIVLGESEGGFVAVRSGLSAGDRVAIGP